MGATTSVDYIYRLQGSRNTNKYKISNKNGENKGTIKTTKNHDSIVPAHITVRSIFQQHIDIQHHFVCEKLISNKICIQYCTTDDNLANLLTKALPKPKHEDLVKQLGMA
jgi:hypothetical protein